MENPFSSFFSTIVDVAPLTYDVPTKGKQGMMGNGGYLKSVLTMVWYDMAWIWYRKLKNTKCNNKDVLTIQEFNPTRVQNGSIL